MQRLTFVEKGTLEWHEVEEPAPGPGQATVRPVAVATCDLDQAILAGRAPFFPAPFPFGHECVAEVVELGEGVDGGLAPGALVSVPCEVSCGECANCRRGDDAHCAAVPRLSVYGMGEGGRRYGGFLSAQGVGPSAQDTRLPGPGGGR